MASINDTVSYKVRDINQYVMKIFITGFTQVFLIAINTYLISKEFLFGVFMSTFAINIVWSYNVKKMSIGTTKERILYSLGASFGAVCGLSIAKLLV